MVALVLASAALHAGWNFALRRHGDSPAATALVLAGSVAVALLAALVFLPVPEGAFAAATPWAMAAGLSEAIYFVSLSRALQIGPLAAVYAISRGASMVVLWPAAHVLLGEPIGARDAAAVLALLAGLALLAPGGARPATTRAGYGWAALSAVFIVANHLVYKRAISLGREPAALYVIAMATALPFVILALGERDRPRLARLRAAAARNPGLLAFGAVAVATSFLLALEVMRFRGAAWMMTLRNSSIAIVQILGWALLRERPTARAGAARRPRLRGRPPPRPTNALTAFPLRA